jgi:hypothetical protein
VSEQLEFTSAQVARYIGKRLLVGITYLDKNEQVTRLEQFHGLVVRINKNEGIVVKINDLNTERFLPPDLDQIHEASPGDYKLKASGEIVVNPDYIATWARYESKESKKWAN